MRLLTLGGIELRTAEGRAVAIQQKRLALLCYLTLRESGSYVQRHAAASVLWPDSTEIRARSALRTALHHLRGDIGADAILARGDEEIAVNPHVVWCDALEFERASKAAQFEEALALYRGPLLDGFLPSGLPEFGDWMDQKRRAFHWLAVHAARTLAEQASERSSAAAVPWVQRWIELAPYEEPAIRALMQVLLASGNRAQALDAFQNWSERLARDLNAQPSAETLRIADTIQSAARQRRSVPAIADSSPPPAERPPHVRRRPLRYAAGALAVLLIAAAALVLNRPEAERPPATIAVFPFSYGGGEQYRYLGSGMVELLGDQLGSTRGVLLVDSRAILKAVGRDQSLDVRRARDIARRLDGTHFVLGSILELNGGVQLSASLYDARRQKPALANVTLKGDVAHLFESVNRLGGELLANALRIESVTAPVGTESLPAAQAFLEGERAFLAGQYQSAAEAFKRAVDYDSTFARAHLSLSFAANWTGEWQLETRAIATALRYSARLSENDRMLLNAWSAHTKPRPRAADSLYSLLLQRSPQNAEAWFQLGEVRFHWGPTFGNASAQSRSAFEQTLRLMPGHGGALVHLLRLDARLGDTTTVNGLARHVGQVGARKQERIEAAILAAAAAGDEDAFRKSFGEYLEQRGGATAVSGLIVNMYRYDWADQAIRAALRADVTETDRIHLRVLLAQIEAGRGNLRGALDEAQSLTRTARARAAETTATILSLPFLDVAPAELHAARIALRPYLVFNAQLKPTYRNIGDDGIYYPRAAVLDGLLALRLQDESGVDRALQLLGAIPTQHIQLRALADQYAAVLRARRALSTNDASGALASLGEPDIEADMTYADLLSLPYDLARWTRAEAYEKLGRDREALRWYASFPDPAAADLMFLIEAHRRQARLHDKLGERAAADADRRAANKLSGTLQP